MADWEFIVTEFLGSVGEDGERLIWEALIKALKGTGEGIACLNYTDFKHVEQMRYQPDILLVSRDWGIAVIEVKMCRIEQILEIRANRWEMQNFYARHISPFKQGENQLRQILKRCNRSPELRDRIPGRVIVALPCITRDEWRERGFEADHPTCPPIIFGDELGRRSLLDAIEYRSCILDRGESPLTLDDQDWLDLRHLIVGHPKLIKGEQPRKQKSKVVSNPRRSDILRELETWMSDFDLQQAKIAMQIPPGPQRIRGIAGSGKTILLCQKAARMHLQHPDWDIALVFFTRSLYQLVPDLLRFWLKYWSDGEIEPDFVNGKLKVLHAWGSRDRVGLYSLLRDRNGGSKLVSQKSTGSLPERLAASCKRLLETAEIEPMFDVILIDEGQDLVISDELKYEDKQTIYWMAWQALRPIEPNQPHLRRLIWSYDEAQSLDSLTIPAYREIFGDELGAVLSGQRTGATYKGGIQKSEVMKRCYRTPGPILVAAHAIGMGLLRPAGMLSGFTTQEEWSKIGYEVVKGDFRRPGQLITLHRPPEHSPNPIPELWGSNPLEFEVYDDHETQVAAIVNKIRHNINAEGLQPSRDILVIVLGGDVESQETAHAVTPSVQLQRQMANALRSQGLNYYLPGAKEVNRYPDSQHQNADMFWCEDAVTVSRIHRAKGHEAKMVYIIGLEYLAQAENNAFLRNQLFVAMTRSMAWIYLSGLRDSNTQSDYLLYDEVRYVITSGNTLTFAFRNLPKQFLAEDV